MRFIEMSPFGRRSPRDVAAHTVHASCAGAHRVPPATLGVHYNDRSGRPMFQSGNEISQSGKALGKYGSALHKSGITWASREER